MLQFPAWKTALISLVCLAGLLFTLPNAFFGRAERALDARVAVERSQPETPERAAAMAGWPSWLPGQVVSLGLDLRGGVHLLAEVQVQEVYAERVTALWPEVREKLQGLRERIGTIRRVESAPGELRVRIGTPEAMPDAIAAAQDLTNPVVSLTGVGSRDFEITSEGDVMVLRMSEAEKAATDERTMAQALEIIRRRVDETGTREPTIQRQGTDRILVQVPGLGSADELKALIGTTAKLTFHPVYGAVADPATDPGQDRILVPGLEDKDTYYVLDEKAVVDGEMLVDAQPTFDQNGRPAVNFRFDATGGRIFGEYTAENIGNPFAIVLDNAVVSAPTIQAHITGGNGQITGQFTVEESTNLAVLLRAGALPATVKYLEERTVGPELGADSIAAGKMASIAALIAILIYMWLSYGLLFGTFANIALVVNLVLIIAFMTVTGITLTLPGIAGIVLTMGQAVDGNVLVFERTREELRAGKGPARAIELGYEKALSAIIDANVTTVIAAAALVAFGSGAVKGFGWTLLIGVFTTVFTVIWVTRMITSLWFAWARPKMIEV
jgi:preprotein translocase subunit SecD